MGFDSAHFLCHETATLCGQSALADLSYQPEIPFQGDLDKPADRALYSKLVRTTGQLHH